MSDEGQKRDDANKTLMFDPAQTEAFKKMARLARQQAEQGQPGVPNAAPVVPGAVVPGAPVPGAAVPGAPVAARPAPVIDQDNANKTMMFGASELAQVRPGSALPASPVVPGAPAGPTTIPIDSSKTMIFTGPIPAPAPSKPKVGMPDEIAALASGLDAAIGNAPAPSPVAPRPAPVAGATQFYVPAVGPAQQTGGETVAYSPEQMARIRQGMQPAETGGQTMLYNTNESAQLKEAFDLLKRHQAIESERSTQARAEAEALLKGIGDEPVAATVPRMEPVAAPQPTLPTSPLTHPAEAGAPSRQALPLTAAPAQPRQGAVRSGAAKFETGQPRKSKAGTVVLVVLLVALGAALVAVGLDYLKIIDIPGIDF